MRIKNFFERTASRATLALAAAGLRRETTISTTRTVTKGKPFGRYIEYKHVPSFVVELPHHIVRMPELHRFLHATKGWRVYSRLPQALIATSRHAADPAPEPRYKQRPKRRNWTPAELAAGSTRAARRNARRAA